MTKYTRTSQRAHLHADIEGFELLAELALDMRSSWIHIKDNLWRQLNPGLWDISQNPWAVLQSLSRERIERALADPYFRRNLMELMQARQQVAMAPEPHQPNPRQISLSSIDIFKL